MTIIASKLAQFQCGRHCGRCLLILIVSMTFTGCDDPTTASTQGASKSVAPGPTPAHPRDTLPDERASDIQPRETSPLIADPIVRQMRARNWTKLENLVHDGNAAELKDAYDLGCMVSEWRIMWISYQVLRRSGASDPGVYSKMILYVGKQISQYADRLSIRLTDTEQACFKLHYDGADAAAGLSLDIENQLEAKHDRGFRQIYALAFCTDGAITILRNQEFSIMRPDALRDVSILDRLSRELNVESTSEAPGADLASKVAAVSTQLFDAIVAREVNTTPSTGSDGTVARSMTAYGSLDKIVNAAKAGDPGAMRTLGTFYEAGVLTNQDYAQAMAWYRRAADTGDAIAMSKIGGMYFNGRGVDQNYVQARQWFRKAANAGDGVSMGLIGVMYSDGLGVTRDLSEAMRWYRKGANAGDSMCMQLIGQMYERGEGVPRDAAAAYEWMRKSADAGNFIAKQWLDQHK